MDHDHEQRIRELAYSIWQSAERPYWAALEYWLMAEKMIKEIMKASDGRVIGAPVPTQTTHPERLRSHPDRLAGE